MQLGCSLAILDTLHRAGLRVRTDPVPHSMLDHLVFATVRVMSNLCQQCACTRVQIEGNSPLLFGAWPAGQRSMVIHEKGILWAIKWLSTFLGCKDFDHQDICSEVMRSVEINRPF